MRVAWKKNVPIYAWCVFVWISFAFFRSSLYAASIDKHIAVLSRLELFKLEQFKNSILRERGRRRERNPNYSRCINILYLYIRGSEAIFCAKASWADGNAKEMQTKEARELQFAFSVRAVPVSEGNTQNKHQTRRASSGPRFSLAPVSYINTQQSLTMQLFSTANNRACSTLRNRFELFKNFDFEADKGCLY